MTVRPVSAASWPAEGIFAPLAICSIFGVMKINTSSILSLLLSALKTQPRPGTSFSQGQPASPSDLVFLVSPEITMVSPSLTISTVCVCFLMM
jgi:hypothetical protein